MSRRGRKPSSEPALAFDYRRYMTLVQVLAHPNCIEGILALCKGWGVEPDYKWDLYEDEPPLDKVSTICRLARHCVEYHRVEAE